MNPSPRRPELKLVCSPVLLPRKLKERVGENRPENAQPPAKKKKNVAPRTVESPMQVLPPLRMYRYVGERRQPTAEFGRMSSSGVSKHYGRLRSPTLVTTG